MNTRVKFISLGTKTRGMSLIELMVSVIIGLLVVGAAIAIFISNGQTYTATENVGRIQENMRTSYELMSRDIRESGSSPCARNLPVANVLNNSATNWWSNWQPGTIVFGYDETQASPGLAFGTAAGTRISGTDAIQLMSASNSGFAVNTHNAASDSFTLSNTVATDLAAGDIVIACNYTQAAIFQLNTAPATIPATVTYAASGTPGNCGTNLGKAASSGACGTGPDTNLSTPAISTPTIIPQVTLAKLRVVRWYIGNSSTVGERSLYQTSVTNTTGTSAPLAQEIATGVQNMTVTYPLNGVYLTAASVPAASWSDVSAVRVILTLQGNDRIGTDGNQIQRQLSSTITLRNRNI